MENIMELIEQCAAQKKLVVDAQIKCNTLTRALEDAGEEFKVVHEEWAKTKEKLNKALILVGAG